MASSRCVLKAASSLGLPKMKGTFLGVPLIRITVYEVHIAYMGNYQPFRGLL